MCAASDLEIFRQPSCLSWNLERTTKRSARQALIAMAGFLLWPAAL